MSETVVQLVGRLRATPCIAARQWLASLPADTTPEDAWRTCPKPHWRLWVRDNLPFDSSWDDVIGRIPDLLPRCGWRRAAGGAL
jgi:hypothetical protein